MEDDEISIECEPSPELTSIGTVINFNVLTDESGNILTDESGNPILPG